ncbi:MULTISPECIES: rhamnulose-1-phosphate aldolase [unclassified Gilliamella]|uniref:rhamnulose-1-phosphate aldolase n=1 Tax=unclassified Gilliamella TaxID=2685620 RepID=UPI00226AA35B|nr:MULTISPECIES: rhamnulose-1-phosphate aldolase [unclassified Gilliamella]MCX8641142.1 rhamnulose-1-phosphate aldolase [Gilliamella sp. B3835]MCX8707099.1 rhamnulose-1-phosphate aldolase [Gilliamella sp. B3783]MCX8710404.1 rhamnulose-1-phosphate aldolase [Gilliamella sp. B3780]MCX8711498.1 rhamnulose-1-phosphate aldolase [Gilliamella sp. B3468]MCX8715086.1 rhamnulose-1-phosphate aldolase [Gilliamella sp. B3781]
MQQILSSWFVQGMIKATYDMWLKGWDERNGGNVSLRLLDTDVVSFQGDFYANPRHVSLTQDVAKLANQYFIVTGSGKFFRNVILDPADTLAIVKIDEQGKGYYIMWGLINGGLPTSELAAHLQSHIVRMEKSQGKDRVIMHCHATNLIALTYVLELDTAVITRLLWEMSTECLVVFPDGVGVVPWMVPGKDEIGYATAQQMAKHTLVLWAFHGVFGTGPTLDEAFGLIDTAEKSAEVLVKVLSMGGKRQTISTEQFRLLAQRFDVNPIEEALKP